MKIKRELNWKNSNWDWSTINHKKTIFKNVIQTEGRKQKNRVELQFKQKQTVVTISCHNLKFVVKNIINLD